MAMAAFTTHQVVKFTAEKIAVSTDPKTFQALCSARALAWGTPGYGVMADAFDAFMAPYQAQALALVKPMLEKASEQSDVNAAFESMISGMKADFDAQLAEDEDEDESDPDSYPENLDGEDEQ